jgi:hypothetical protein
MKNLLLLLLMTVSTVALAQTPATLIEKLHVGLHGGWSGSTMAFQKKPLVEGKAVAAGIEHGYFIGAFARQPLNRVLAARAEAQYHVRGYRFLEARNRFSFLEFIPMLECRLTERLSAGVGGYWAICLEQKLRTGDGGSFASVDPDIVELTDGQDFGAVLGLNFHWKRYTGILRYQHGFNSAVDIEYSDINGSLYVTRQYNRSIQVGIGYSLL